LVIVPIVDRWRVSTSMNLEQPALPVRSVGLIAHIGEHILDGTGDIDALLHHDHRGLR
jgi:hypothetical protein